LESTDFSINPNILCHRSRKFNTGFYDYYQLLQRKDESTDDDEELGSKAKEESKGYMDGLHSPFGILGDIKTKRGYTHHQIMWSQPWAMYLLEMADEPRYVKGDKPAPVAESAEDLRKLLPNR